MIIFYFKAHSDVSSTHTKLAQKSCKSTLAIGINLAAPLKKGDDCGELVLPSLPKLAQRTEEREELVCCTMNKGGQSRPTGAVLVESEGGEKQGGGGACVATHPALQGGRQNLL